MYGCKYIHTYGNTDTDTDIDTNTYTDTDTNTNIHALPYTNIYIEREKGTERSRNAYNTLKIDEPTNYERHALTFALESSFKDHQQRLCVDIRTSVCKILRVCVCVNRCVHM